MLIAFSIPGWEPSSLSVATGADNRLDIHGPVRRFAGHLTANGGHRTVNQQQLPNAREDDLSRQPGWPIHNGTVQHGVVPLEREKEKAA